MQRVSVSEFKAKIAAYLRAVQRGEAFVITEHHHPIATVHQTGAGAAPYIPAKAPFTTIGITTAIDVPGLAQSLIDEERGER